MNNNAKKKKDPVSKKMSADHIYSKDQPFRGQRLASVSGSNRCWYQKIKTIPSQAQKIQLIPSSGSSCRFPSELPQWGVRKRAVAMMVRAQAKDGGDAQYGGIEV